MLPDRIKATEVNPIDPIKRIGLWQEKSDDPDYTEYIRKDIYSNLESAAKQVIDELGNHDDERFYCIEALKKTLRE